MIENRNKLADRLEAAREAARAGVVPGHLSSGEDRKTDSAWGPAMRT